MTTIATLDIELAANVIRIQKDLERIGGVVDKHMGGISKAAGLAQTALGALGVGLSVAGMASFLKTAIDIADAANDLAQKLGISVTALQGKLSVKLNRYEVLEEGSRAGEIGTIGNRTLGSHQGLSGGTMGSLARYTNNTTTAAGAGSNTAVIVGHSAALGGEYIMTAQVAAAVDNIVCSYQVPAGTTAVQGRRLRIQGVKIAAANIGAAVATTATLLSYHLAFGHTAISLATAETGSFVTATAHAPRRVSLGVQSWAVGAAVGATAPDVYMPFTQPIFVNPGEFVAVAAKFVVGTATASQAIYFNVTFDYGWE
jgi:hypothetical protein